MTPQQLNRSPSLPPPPHERRQHPRYELNTSAILIDGDWRSHRCWCRDISKTGLSVQARLALQLGEMVQVWVELPGHSSLDLRAKVVRYAANRIGLRLSGTNALERHQLSEMLSGPSRQVAC
jgi:hypothetical protein